MANPSRSLVRQPAPPAPHVDYRFDLTRRSVAGFAAAGIAVVFLIFLCGLVIGVSMKVGAGSVAAEPAQAAEPKAPSPAASAAAPAYRDALPPDTVPALVDPADPLMADTVPVAGAEGLRS